MKLMHSIIAELLGSKEQSTETSSSIVLTIVQLSLNQVKDVYSALHAVQIISDFVSLGYPLYPHLFTQSLAT